MMNAIKSFNGKATYYTESRPGYPENLIKDLYNLFGFSKDAVIADIGCGTGKFAVELLKRGSTVYCVEPNQNMRSICAGNITGYSKGKIINGKAENTGLPRKTVDFITVAQAFHWFDLCSFRTECEKIMRDKGKIVLVWNIRDTASEVMQETYAVHKKFCTNFNEYKENFKAINTRIAMLYNGDYQVRQYDNAISYDKKGFISRNLSSSYSLTSNEKNFPEYVDCFEKVFDKYAEGGTLHILNKTRAFIGHLGRTVRD